MVSSVSLEINNFIRETFLGALADQLNEEVRELVSEALGIFTESEEQLKASKEPLVQHQSALGCSSESSSATMPTEGGFLSNTEVDTTRSPTVNVTEIAQAVVTLSIDYLIILQEIDASTFPNQVTSIRSILNPAVSNASRENFSEQLWDGWSCTSQIHFSDPKLRGTNGKQEIKLPSLCTRAS